MENGTTLPFEVVPEVFNNSTGRSSIGSCGSETATDSKPQEYTYNTHTSDYIATYIYIYTIYIYIYIYIYTIYTYICTVPTAYIHMFICI